MKKLSSILFILTVSYGLSFGQEDYNKYRFGIYGDLGTAWLKPKTVGYTKAGSAFAYGYGLDFDYHLTKNYVFNSGIYINYLGGKLSYQDTMNINSVRTDGTMVRDYSLQYLEIPLSLKLKTSQMGRITMFVQLGFNAGFRLNAKSDDAFEFSTGNLVTENVDLQSSTNLFKLSFVPAFGAEYELNKSLSAYGRLFFNNGMTDILSGKNAITNNPENAITNKVGISIGLFF